jgi:F0F1-type ATP synthase membrane subunit c/vacuolar-type H+-ATPase subunit K
MFETFLQILERAVEYLALQFRTFAPPLVAATVILLAALLIASGLRWAVQSLFKGVAADRFLAESGLSLLLARSGRLRARRIVAGTVYWLVLGIGVLTALNAFNTEITTRMINAVVTLAPKLLTAGAIVLAGIWLAQYLGHSTLIWASNESVPFARRWAAAVRIVIVFVAVVVTADYLDFARSVFLAAFILLVGGAVIVTGIAVGMAARDALRRQLSQPERDEHADVSSIWNHL